MTAESDEPSELHDLIVRHTPELIPTFSATNRIVSHLTGLVLSVYLAAGIAMALVGEGYASNPLTLVLVVALAATGAAVTELVLRRVQSRALERFFARVSDDPSRVYGAVAHSFRREIELQRRRTLGPESEWGKSRAPLQEALDEATRSAAYWEARVESDLDNVHARAQRDAASQLEGRFREALRQLDGRTDALLGFFSRCEAKIAMLERGKRDLEESRRLAALLERAEGVVAEAELTVELIGREFLTEVARVGRALGGLERLQMLHLAGELPLETIETLADRVIEGAAHERERLRELLEEVSAGSRP